MFKYVGIPFAWILAKMYGLIGNYGLTLILFTLLTSAAMIPMYAKQMKNTARMSQMQPKIAEIQARYADNRELQNQKLQEFYQKEHYNPTSGCLPSILQLVIVMLLYAVLRNPLNYITSDTTFAMAVHESFLWVQDMSQPDLWILPILAGLSQFAMTLFMSPSGSQGGSSKVMSYGFPIIILWLGRTLPAGLCLYWVVRSAFSAVQNIFINKATRKEKLRAEVEREFK